MSARVESARPVVIGREEFLADYWTYKSGEHVTLIAPTQSGKTTLAFQLLARSAGPSLPAVVLVMKPRDAVPAKWGTRLGFRTIRSWPPPLQAFRARPPGYLLWPKHTYDLARDNARLESEFARALTDVYKRGRMIVFADELYGVCVELGLDTECMALWTRGSSGGGGLWSATQKPSHIPTWAYNSAEHVFLSREPDKRNRLRFNEIGGIDGDYVRDAVLGLRKYQWLYIRRSGPHVCIIDKD